MHVLFICPYTPTLIRTRPYNLIHSLIESGHRVTLATLTENASEQRALDELSKRGVRVMAERLTKPQVVQNLVRAVTTGKPLQAYYSWQPNLARRILATVQNQSSPVDVVHVEHLRGAQYGTYLKSQPGHQVPVVWDSVDCISFLFEQAARVSRNPFGRMVTRVELPRTRRHEAWLLEQFARVLVTSSKDRQAFVELAERFGIKHITANQHITVLSNGVDLDYFTPLNLTREPRTLVLTGKMSYHANATAALYLVNDVMPLVWAQSPDVRVQIVGQKPPSAVRSLAEREPTRVMVTGGVPDLRPYLAQATVAVAPIMYGAGIQNKVLEAMAMETPVVTTEVSVAALNVRRGEEVLVGDSPASLAREILRLMDDPALREQVARQGRRYVEQNHDWKKITQQLIGIYTQPLAHSQPVPISSAGE